MTQTVQAALRYPIGSGGGQANWEGSRQHSVNTFLLAQKYNVGRSLVEKQSIDLAKDLLMLAKEKNVIIPMPIDVRTSHNFDKNSVDKTWSKKDKNWKLSPLMPIRVKYHD